MSAETSRSAEPPVMVPGRSAARRLRWTLVGFVALNVLATLVAVRASWPAQFGGVGTDAGDEFLARGTALSAPLPPVVTAILAAVLAPRRDRWGWVGLGLAYAVAVVICIGGIGELASGPTPDVPGVVLVASGVLWTVVALVIVAFATAAMLRPDRREAGSRPAAA